MIRFFGILCAFLLFLAPAVNAAQIRSVDATLSPIGTLEDPTGESTHTAPGGKKTLNLSVSGNVAISVNKITITPPGAAPTVLQRYIGDGAVPAGKYRVTGENSSTPEIEFGTAPAKDTVVDIEWIWQAGEPSPTVTERTPAWS